MARHPWKTKKYIAVEEALNADLGAYIDAYRKRLDPVSGKPVSWATIAREIWADTEIEVSHESVRNWHTAWVAETPIGAR